MLKLRRVLAAQVVREFANLRVIFSSSGGIALLAVLKRKVQARGRVARIQGQRLLVVTHRLSGVAELSVGDTEVIQGNRVAIPRL